MSKKIKIWVMLGFTVIVLLLLKLLFDRRFDSVESLQNYMKGFGMAAPLALTVFQAMQVVVPVLPGGLGCLAGVLLFGPVWGFAYNYVGICIGSLLSFAVARSCGRPLLHLLFSEKTIQKYDHWTTERNRFAKLFFWSIFLPIAPDDFLCYLAGTTSMSWKRYTAIILLGKPFNIALYSLGLMMAWQLIVG